MTENFYELFWQHGYKRLMVVSPHDDPMRYAGKRPAVRGPNGWYGVSVRTFEATPEQLPEWASWGGGVGLRCDRDHIGIDIDSMSAEWVEKLKQIALEELGAIGARRIGRAPRTMLVYRVDETITYDQRRFDDGTEGGGLIELIAGETRWFVVHGVHPKTLVPYSWPDKVPRSEQLPVVTKAQLANFFARLDAELPKVAGKSNTLTDRAAVEQRALIVEDLSIVRQLLEKTPNLYEQTAYKELLELAAALRAVSQDDPETGEEIFLEFAERTNLEEQTENPLRVYRSLQPPFAFGMSYILQFAHQRSDDPEQKPFQAAVAAFNYDPSPPEYVAPEPSLFDLSVREPVGVDVYPMLTLGEIINRPPPSFLVARHIPEVGMGFLYSVPGAGKSFLMLDTALTIAYGFEGWHGDAIRTDPEAIVLYIAAEGSFGFRNRAKAWMQAHRVTSLPKRFLLIERTIDFMKVEDIDKLLRTVHAVAGLRPCLIVVDTVSRAMPGADENLQKEMTLFVRACDRLKETFRCAVVGVHHAGKNGDMRGSTVLLGAGDFVFKLERKQGATIGNLFCEKQKDAPDGWEEPYRFDLVTLEDGETSLVVDRADLSVGPTLELTPLTSRAVLEAMRAAWVSGEPWAKAAQSGERRAVRRMVADFGFKAVAAEELLQVWEQTGLVKIELASSKNKKFGFKVLSMPDNVSAGDSIFD